MKLTIGIDPGLHGAIAVLDEEGVLVALTDFQIIEHNKLKWIDGNWLQGWFIEHVQYKTAHAVIEHVHSMPSQGVASSFQFGVGFGSLLGVVQARHIPLTLVRSTQWKRDMGLVGKDQDGKKQALSRARLLWPTAELHLAKHDGRAEALLIAAWSINKARGMGNG